MAVCVAAPSAQPPPPPPPSPPSPALSPPTGTLAWSDIEFHYTIDTGSYTASSLTLVMFASDNTVLATYTANPTSAVTQDTNMATTVVAKLFAYAKVMVLGA
ncbi:hypothetical protein ACKKBF_B11635 [Auxenochlorella protothecoides x Auxenochlorella symbiontica]